MRRYVGGLAWVPHKNVFHSSYPFSFSQRAITRARDNKEGDEIGLFRNPSHFIFAILFLYSILFLQSWIPWRPLKFVKTHEISLSSGKTPRMGYNCGSSWPLFKACLVFFVSRICKGKKVLFHFVPNNIFVLLLRFSAFVFCRKC